MKTRQPRKNVTVIIRGVSHTEATKLLGRFVKTCKELKAVHRSWAVRTQYDRTPKTRLKLECTGEGFCPRCYVYHNGR